MFSTYQTYLTFGGTLGTSGGGFDVWQCGLHVADPNETLVPPLPSPGELADFQSLVAGMIGSSVFGVSQGVLCTWVKAAGLNLAGEYTDEPSIREFAAVAGGGAGASAASPQDSLAITLWSGSTFGKANYGRFYLPWNTLNVNVTTGVITLNPSAATDAAAFVDGVNDWFATLPGTLDAKVCNMSKVGLGTTKQVTQVRVGNAKDTQRRRRNNITETYLTAAV